MSAMRGAKLPAKTCQNSYLMNGSEEMRSIPPRGSGWMVFGHADCPCRLPTAHYLRFAIDDLRFAQPFPNRIRR